MTSTPDLDPAVLHACIGREQTGEDIVTPELARRLHATLDLQGPVPDREGDIVPRLIHWCLAQPALPAAELGPDGHPARGNFLPSTPSLPRRMWAGGDFVFTGELCVGDHVKRVSRIADIALKEGRTGHLCFVTVAHEIQANGRVVVQERQNIVYREPEHGVKKALPPAVEGVRHRQIDPTTTLLFRYSALTFNGHRIHYDRDYATGTEGYNGLVVHGPMQAQLLLLLAAEVRGTPPSHFSYRGVSPITDVAPFYLHSQDDGDDLRLWTAYEGGPEAMTGLARWA